MQSIVFLKLTTFSLRTLMVGAYRYLDLIIFVFTYYYIAHTKTSRDNWSERLLLRELPLTHELGFELFITNLL